MKLLIAILAFIWLLSGAIGGWMLDDMHWKTIARGPLTLEKAFSDNPPSYPGP
jgi:hypothetical protein